MVISSAAFVAAAPPSHAAWFIVLAVGLGLFVGLAYLIDEVMTHLRLTMLAEKATRDPGLTVSRVRALTKALGSGIEGLVRALLAFSVIGVLAIALIYELVRHPASRTAHDLTTIVGTLATAIVSFYFATRAAQGSGGTADAAATATAEKTASHGAPTNVKAPSIWGPELTVGTVITSAEGTWEGEPASFDFDWQHNDESTNAWISVQKGPRPSYTLKTSDQGKKIRLIVTAVNDTGSVKSPPSNQLGPVVPGAGAPSNVNAPSISAPSVEVKAVIRGVEGEWHGEPTNYTYEWQRSASGRDKWTSVQEGPSPSYELKAGDRGRKIRLVVTAENDAGRVESPASPPVGPVT